MKEGWKVVKLGEVCEFLSGYTPKKEDLSSSGKYPYFKVAEMNLPGNEFYLTETLSYLNTPKKFFPKGSIVFPKNGGAIYTEKKRILKQDSVIDLNSEAIIANERFVDIKYLYLILSKLRISSFDKGGGLPSLDINKMMNCPIPLPPLPEQHRIVKKLDAAFEKIDAMKAKAEKNIENAKALFQQALAEELEPKEGWVEKKFGEVCRYYKEQGKYVDMKYIGMEHIESCTGRLLGSMDSNAVLSSSFKFNKGHVLYGRLRPYLKKVYVAEFEGCCSTEIFPIYSDVVNTGFIKYWLLTDWITNLINQTSAGCRMPRGNMEQVKTFLISFPQDKEIQQQIVTKLDILSTKCKKLEEAERKTIAECDALKQAILRQAFNGEL